MPREAPQSCVSAAQTHSKILKTTKTPLLPAINVSGEPTTTLQWQSNCFKTAKSKMTHHHNALACIQNVSNSLWKLAIDLICLNTLDKRNLVSDCKNYTKCYRTPSVCFESDLSSSLPWYELHTIAAMNKFRSGVVSSAQNCITNSILCDKVWYGPGTHLQLNKHKQRKTTYDSITSKTCFLG